MIVSDVKHVYFIGIGGIGMSAIARYFLAQGKRVSGYDKTRTVLTENLAGEGMNIFYREEVDLIPGDVDLVIYTPAIPSDHTGFQYLLKSGIKMIKRSEALGWLSNGLKSIGVAGTHGKTTTSIMVTHVLKVGGIDISAFLGGIATDYESNFLAGSSDVVVLEADEYDRSFLRLNPYIASISSMDPDHLDIYGDKNAMIESGYKAYANKVQDNGYLILKEGLIEYFTKEEINNFNQRNITLIQYGYDKNCDIIISEVKVSGGKYVFDFEGLDTRLEGVVVNLPGSHNVENATVAIVVGILLEVKEVFIRSALENFKGIKRRFEKIIETEDFVYIDDYAHHPGELRVAIDGARTLYPTKKLVGIFQPHLYTRTRDFVEGFAEELDKMDEILIMDIYPARELSIEGVTSEIIFEKMKNPNKTLVTKDTLMDFLDRLKPEILMTLGAGDIDTFVPKIKEKYNNNVKIMH